MDMVSQASLTRPEVRRWHRRIIERYTPPSGIKLSILLPCSRRKPYSRSKSHLQIRDAVTRGAGKKLGLVHEVIITSPLGLVPRELECVYPAAHYDVPVTGHWSPEEVGIVQALLGDYLEKAKTEVIAHLEGGYAEACGGLGLEFTDGLEGLEKRVREVLKDLEPGKRSYKLESVEKVCDFQFGKGAGERLLGRGARLRGMRVFRGKGHVASLNPNTGLLSLTLEGGKLLEGQGCDVEVDFVPGTDSLFCPAVVNAGEGIRPGDEVVVVHKGNVVGVGRAALNGEEMVRAKKGLAVSLRHRVRA